jgi:peptide/nickel transport system permease protein
MSSTVTVEPSDSLGNPTEVVDAAPKRSWFQASVPTLLFIGRRLLSSLIVLLGATFILYMMLALSLDFLEDLRASTDPNAPALIEQRIALLNLDTPPIGRYFMWLTGLFTGNGMGTTWGQAFGQQSVWGLLMTRIPQTLSLVLAASVLSILLGIMVGIVSALRQYTRFDYSVTFLSFVLFSLPSFWVAVLLKTWGAIGFNDFFQNPHFPWWAMLLVPLVMGVIWSAIIGGHRRTRWLSFIISALVTLAFMFVLTHTVWLQNPVLGIPGILILGLGIAFALTAAVVGIQPASKAVLTDDAAAAMAENGGVLADADTTKAGFGAWLSANRALAAGLTTALLGAALYIPLQFVFVHANWGLILLLALIALVVGAVIGWLWGGYDRRVSMRVAALTALLQGLFIFVDRVLQTWWHYNRAPQINFRPIATIGSNTPGIENFFNNNFWFMNLDRFTHVLLPTLTLLLISFAGYTRYTRGSMLEVMNQDYIRTARAKGLPERVVTLRHAFRNALIPLATIIPLDLAGLLGGAIITEQIFGWPGMGQLFIQALNGREVEVIMGHFLVTGTLLVIGTIVVDFIYAALDPRIRVDA